MGKTYKDNKEYFKSKPKKKKNKYGQSKRDEEIYALSKSYSY